jgi:hypothetical protein
MSPKKGKLTRLLTILLAFLVSFILFLEIGSRLYYDGVPEAISLPPAVVCDPAVYPPNSKKLAALERLQSVYLQGTRITPAQLEEILVAAPQEDMPNMNGVFCNGMVYVSQRLSPSARYYVARHELEHYFQIQGIDEDCQDWELCATWEAAREYPWGFVTTITSSLWESFRLSSSLGDFLFGAWTIFKIYLLP